MNMHLKMETIKTMDDIKELFQFDNDFNGENGDEYLSEEAVDGGFSSDLDYAISEAKKNVNGDLHKGFLEVLKYFEDYSGDYYLKLESKQIVTNDGEVVVSLVCVS